METVAGRRRLERRRAVVVGVKVLVAVAVPLRVPLPKKKPTNLNVKKLREIVLAKTNLRRRPHPPLVEVVIIVLQPRVRRPRQSRDARQATEVRTNNYFFYQTRVVSFDIFDAKYSHVSMLSLLCWCGSSW